MAQTNIIDKNIERQIITFAHILRSAGVTLGISEIMEALEVLSVLDVTDRDQVYRGLSAVMAKSRRDERAFDEAFNAFFVPPQVRDAQMAQYFLRHQQLQCHRLVRPILPIELGKRQREWCSFVHFQCIQNQ